MINNMKYKNVEHKGRIVNDLRSLLFESVELYDDHAAYLVKDRKKGQFVPISYKQVGRDIEGYGTKLLNMGLGGKKIAVIGETRYEWLLTYFATVSGVGVIVPLDKNLPSGELLGLLKRSGASALVYSDKSRKVVEPIMEENSDVACYISMDLEEHTENEYSLKQLVKEGRRLVDEGDCSFIDVDVDPDQMSTLLFTSGTTGMAKGVKLSHRNIASNVCAMSKFFKIPEPGIVLSILPVNHVYEMTCDIWTTFYQGKTIAICEGIRYIQKNMVETHANVMLGVPLVFEKMYKGMWKQARKRGQEEKLRKAIDLSKRMKLYKNDFLIRKMFKSIHQSFGGEMKVFIAGGAAADPFVIEEMEAMGITMLQGYGMSESAPIIAMNQDRCRKSSSVGIPLPGTKVRIINQDEDGVGEVIVKGPSVMMGYYENEEASSKALQNGWLHTGDLGYFDNDGFLYLTGRAKTVIVTKGGKNIFPEEVENVLMENDFVKEVLVHGVSDDRVGNVIIAADIYPNMERIKEKEGEMTRSQVYHFFRDIVDDINETMPPYKQIKRINIRSTEFIKTTTGKIKRYGNSLSSEDIRAAGEIGMDRTDRKKYDLKIAKRFASDINNSDSPYTPYKEVRPVTDVKNILEKSRDAFSSRTAFIDKPAPDMDYVEHTYNQFITDMEGLGTALMNRGGYEKKIAIIGNNSYQWQISYLTVMSGVGVSVPINRQLPIEEIERELNEVGAEILIYGDQYEKIAENLRNRENTALKQYIRYGEEDELDFDRADDDRRENPEREYGILSWKALVNEGKNQMSCGDRQYLDSLVTGPDLAAIFHTSGKGGKHKTVPLTHENIVSNIMMVSSMVDYKPDDVIFSVIAPHNIYQCNMGLVLPLYKGAAIANSQGTDYLGSNLEDVKPTIFLAEPVMISELYEDSCVYIENSGKEKTVTRLAVINKVSKKIGVDMLKPVEGLVKNRLGGRMRMMISGGAALDEGISRFFRDFGINIVQGYGMTECSSVAAINPDRAKLMKAGSCGRVLPGINAKVINRNRDGIGEILVSGKTIMNGYIGDNDETRRVLIDGWFHTGDLGKIDQDGFVYITGRK